MLSTLDKVFPTSVNGHFLLPAATSLIKGVTSHLDSCNSLLTGLPCYLVPLQSILYMEARCIL